jgi:hypothetical protein
LESAGIFLVPVWDPSGRLLLAWLFPTETRTPRPLEAQFARAGSDNSKK